MRLQKIIIKEALAVARAEGVQVSDKEARECIDKVIASNQANKSSMCMDILAKRRSEIDFINGRVALLAEKHGLQAPFNRAMVCLVKAMQIHYAPDAEFNSVIVNNSDEFKPLPVEAAKNSVPAIASDKPTVAVLGAGGNACLLGGLLASGGLEVTFVDRWQEQCDALNKNGLKIIVDEEDQRTVSVKATTDPKTLGKFDVVLIACNSFETRGALTNGKNLLHNDTLVVSFQSGLCHAETIAEVLESSDNILLGQTLIGASLDEPGVVRAHSKTHLKFPSYVGEWNGKVSERCEKLCQQFTECGMLTLPESDMRKRHWMKLVCNCVTAPLSALTKHGITELFKCRDFDFVAKSIINEVHAVAQKVGVQMSEEESREYIRMLLATETNSMSSMHSDICLERNTEINYINGVVDSLGQEHGIQTPFNCAMKFFVKAVESQYHGIPTVSSKFPHVVDCDASTHAGETIPSSDADDLPDESSPPREEVHEDAIAVTP